MVKGPLTQSWQTPQLSTATQEDWDVLSGIVTETPEEVREMAQGDENYRKIVMEQRTLLEKLAALDATLPSISQKIYEARESLSMRGPLSKESTKTRTDGKKAEWEFSCIMEERNTIINRLQQLSKTAFDIRNRLRGWNSNGDGR